MNIKEKDIPPKRISPAFNKVDSEHQQPLYRQVQEAIREAMAAESSPCAIQWVVNDQFVRGSITSLWAAREEMDDDVVLMDADVLYAPEILARLVRSSQPSALLMDETVKQESEECMVAAQSGRVLSLSKVLPADYEEAGYGI